MRPVSHFFTIYFGIIHNLISTEQVKQFMLYLRSFNRFILIGLTLLGLSVSTAWAATMQSFGAGTAVTAVDFHAEFEVQLGSYNPYSEDGLLFSNAYNKLEIMSFIGESHPGFAGVNDSSIVYGGNMKAPLAISTQGGGELSGLEFNIGTGFSATNTGGYWETYRDLVLVGSGGFNVLDWEDEITFYDSSGFDTLLIAMTNTSTLPTAFTDNNAIAIDHLVARALSPVPAPAAIWLFGTGLIGLVGFGKCRQSA